MEHKTKNKIVNNLPWVLFSVPMIVILYAKFGNPSERFFETANIVSVYIVFTPVILFLLGGLYMTIINGFEKMDNRCKCCCKCCCCKGEK